MAGHILCFLACSSWQLFGIGCIGFKNILYAWARKPSLDLP